MGKSIFHCAVCGQRVGIEAVTVDFRTYCSGCLPPELAKVQAPAPKTSRHQVQSTRRIPRVDKPKPVLPIVVAAAGGIALIGALAFVLTRGGDRTPIEEPVARPAPASKPTPEPKRETPPPVAEPRPAPAVAKTEKTPEAPVPAPEKLPPPRPLITFPAEGALYDAPAAVTIVVELPGDPVKVEFFAGATLIGDASQRPYTLVWRDVPEGTYALTAKAAGVVSASVTIQVNAVVAAAPEDAKKPPPPPPPPGAPVNFGVDPKRVDDAIAKGVAYLKAAGVKGSLDPAQTPGLAETPELILWTLVHANVSENDPDFIKLFNSMLAKKLEKTYAVALQAMILEEVHRVKYQVRIAQCAQWLMDAQCGNGQWSYGGPAQVGTPTTAIKPDVQTGGALTTGVRQKPKVVRKITTLRKMQEGPPTGDNSNSQYAALGLRACHEAGIVIPKVVIQRAQTWWRISQHEEESKDTRVATGEGATAAPAGWCYAGRDHGHAAYSSMTAGAVGSVAIWNFLTDEKTWKKDPTLQKGIAWLTVHFSVAGNEGPSEHVQDTKWMVYYYLYALERAGILSATESFGGHNWYREGAEAILKAQRGDGSWIAPLPHGDRSDTTNAVWDTCFAILFLKRATAPLVASTDVRAGK